MMPPRVGLMILGVTFALFAAVTARADSLPLYGVCFGPYLDGKKPGDGVTESEIERLLRIIADSGYTSRIRTFGADDGLELIPEIAHQLGLTDVAMGSWIAGADPNDPNANAQIRELIEQANAGWAQTLVIGNEEVLNFRFGPSDMVKFVSAVKSQVTVPVVTSEPFEVWFNGDANSASVKPAMVDLVREVTEVYVNIYPFHRDVPIDGAVDELKKLYSAAVNAVHAIDPSKPVVLAETGWPSAGGNATTPVTSEQNAERYLHDVAEWSSTEGKPVYYFEAFDEAWKGGPGYEYEAYWGIWYRPGDFNHDGYRNAADIDILYDNLGDPNYDLDEDNDADQADVNKLVTDLIGTKYGDTNVDFAVNSGDLSLMTTGWNQSGQSWAAGDFTGNGLVNSGDLSLLTGSWNWDKSSPAPAPEPATLALLVLGGVATLRRRRWPDRRAGRQGGSPQVPPGGECACL